MARRNKQVLPSLALKEAYAAIRRWYQEHVQQVLSRNDEYGLRSVRLIRALPAPRAVTDLEIRAVFHEVLAGLLEWAYHESDGQYKMWEYAAGALEAAGLPRLIGEEERQQLRKSPLWPRLTGNTSTEPSEAMRSAASPDGEQERTADSQVTEVAKTVDVSQSAEETSVSQRPRGHIPPPPATVLHSDIWATKDELGFSLYAKTIAEFVDHRQTRAPLTIAILAPWGRGKTTLMRLVRAELARKAGATAPHSQANQPRLVPATTFGKLRTWLGEAGRIDVPKLRYPTIWFNAWKFQNTEQVWAGLAHEIISQLVRGIPREIEREKFWLALQLRRLDIAAIRRDVRGVVLEGIAARVFSWATLGVLALVALVLGLALVAVDQLFSIGNALGAGVVGTGGTLGSLLIQASRAHKNISAKPLEGAYAKYVRQPDYGSKRGMLSDVEEDVRVAFELLVDEQQPAVVFIDDLDRCWPGKVAEVMEAVNLFLSGDFPNCYFVMGVDAQVVAASMEVAHKELTEKLANVARGYGSLGWYFMDKFIQLPFVIPSLSDDQRATFLAQLFEAQRRPTPAAAALASDAERAVGALGESVEATTFLVQQAAQRLAPLREQDPERAREIAERALELASNRFRDEDPEIAGQLRRYAVYLGPSPRTIKRFANLYRFYRMVQWSRDLQGLETASSVALGRWLVLMLRWPQLVRWIQWEGEAHLFPEAVDPFKRATEFEQSVIGASSQPSWLKKQGLEAIPWCADGQLFDFLRATADTEGQLVRAIKLGVW